MKVSYISKEIHSSCSSYVQFSRITPQSKSSVCWKCPQSSNTCYKGHLSLPDDLPLVHEIEVADTSGLDLCIDHDYFLSEKKLNYLYAGVQMSAWPDLHMALQLDQELVELSYSVFCSFGIVAHMDHLPSSWIRNIYAPNLLFKDKFSESFISLVADCGISETLLESRLEDIDYWQRHHQRASGDAPFLSVSKENILESGFENKYKPASFQTQLLLARPAAMSRNSRSMEIKKAWLQSGGDKLEMNRLVLARCHEKAGVDVKGIIGRIKMRFM